MSERTQGRDITPSAVRLPAETRIGTVRLQVADLERSLAWYRNVLGFRVIEGAVDRALLGARGGDGPLLELRERPGAAPVPRGGRPGLYHFAVLLPDRAALGRLLRHLVELGQRFGSADHMVSEALYLQDPDNLGVEVYADRPRSDWKRRNGQVAMATDPLDFGGVVRSAGDGAWSGLPAGTRIGHVHLHVGDLKRATLFYHEALGLDKTAWSYPGALFLSAGGYHHHLGLNTWAHGTEPAGEDDARLLEWELVLPNSSEAKRVAGRLREAGYEVDEASDGGRARDPWGTVVRIRGPEEL